MLWALGDHLGTVRDLVDSSGTVRKHAAYNAFGRVTGEQHYDASGAAVLSTDPAAVDALFGYTGKLFDQAAGLQNNLNRWYDAEVGGWASEDPIGFAAGDANLGRYVENNPTAFVDPDGYNAAGGFFGGVVGGGIAWGMGGDTQDIIGGIVGGAVGGAVTAGTFGLVGGVGSGLAGGAIAGGVGSGAGGVARESVDCAYFGDEFEFGQVAIDTGVGIVTGPISALPGAGDAASEGAADLALSVCMGIWIPTGQGYADLLGDEFNGEQ